MTIKSLLPLSLFIPFLIGQALSSVCVYSHKDAKVFLFPPSRDVFLSFPRQTTQQQVFLATKTQERGKERERRRASFISETKRSLSFRLHGSSLQTFVVPIYFSSSCCCSYVKVRLSTQKTDPKFSPHFSHEICCRVIVTGREKKTFLRT